MPINWPRRCTFLDDLCCDTPVTRIPNKPRYDKTTSVTSPKERGKKLVITTYQRTPISMTAGGKCAPLKLIAIVVLPHDVPSVMEEDHTAKGLKGKLATKPTTAQHNGTSKSCI